jgi:hypothetical protein
MKPNKNLFTFAIFLFLRLNNNRFLTKVTFLYNNLLAYINFFRRKLKFLIWIDRTKIKIKKRFFSFYYYYNYDDCIFHYSI